MTTARTDSAFLPLTDTTFDVTSAEVAAARDLNWYARTPYGLAVLRYPQVTALLKDRRLRQGSAAWPAHNGITEGPFFDWWQQVLLSLEGDDQLRLRRLLNPAFKQRTIEALTPTFQSLAEELIGGFAESGRCEFVSEFSEPYAARIICILLGLPEEDWSSVSSFAVDLGLSLGITIADDLPRIERGLAGLYAACDEMINDRAAHPRDDLVSTLVEASVDGDTLSATELRDALVFLVFAGMDTTRHQLGLALETFLEHPGQWELLGRRPDLGRAAVEEVMRVNPTITWITREALEDFTFDGLDIAAGTTLQLFSQSAGTDPLAMPDPSFDITGQRPMHTGFGGGVHHCLGHWVARADMSVALPTLARRLRAPRRDGPGKWLPRSGNTGPVRFPIAFTPAP